MAPMDSYGVVWYTKVVLDLSQPNLFKRLGFALGSSSLKSGCLCVFCRDHNYARLEHKYKHPSLPLNHIVD